MYVVTISLRTNGLMNAAGGQPENMLSQILQGGEDTKT